MSELKERKDMDPAYEWDLSTLFKNDEDFYKALSQIDETIQQAASYEGRLNNPQDILAFLKKNTELERKINNLFCYASLRRTEDTRDTKAQAMYGAAYGKVVQAQSAAAYGEPELLSLPEEKMKTIIDDPQMKDYRFYLQNLMRLRKHTLSVKEEQLLARFGEVLNNPGETAETLMDADMTFEPAEDKDGKTHEVSSSSFILLESDNDRILRENAFHSFYKAYAGHINTLTKTFSGMVKEVTAEAAVRGYSSGRAMSMAHDNIPESVYDNLIDTIHSRMDVMYHYVKLRKRLLKVDELHYYDVYAPLVQGSTRSYSYEEAQQMVLDAVAPLGKEYTDRVKMAYRDHWIDVYPNSGKGSGAFSSGTYDSNPFIMTNFTGTLESVSTIAHEMGHSQHSWLTNHHQPAQYANYSMFVAEVASTVNENLLIEQLLQKEKDPYNRLVLLNQYLEGFKGTVFRQTMFAEFERDAHAMSEAGETLTPETLNALYERLVRLYFGEDLVLDDEVKYEWARIPHFYYLFYVYVYATGYSSACALSEKILKEGEPAVKRYLEFLSMGSSRYPLDELKHAGVDLTTPAPINTAIDKFEAIIEDAEKTADKLGL